MPRPTVSVILPTFNRKELLPRALDSVIRQTFQDWEIVLVDDGSTDDTASLAKLYTERLGNRFRFLPEIHRGPCHARNRGIEAARGEFLAFLDSDDEYLPSKLDRQLELFGRRPELGLVYSDYACIDLQDRYFPSVFDTKQREAREVPSREVAPRQFICDPGVLDALLRRYFIATITGLVRRDILGSRIRFLDDPAYAEEWLFYAEIVRAHRVGYIDEPLSLHHFTAGSVSRTSSHENTVRLVRTLNEMRRRLRPLTKSQDVSLRRHLSAAHGQLGYDASRTGAFASAAKHMLKALRFEARYRWIFEALHAIGSALWHRVLPSASRIDTTAQRPTAEEPAHA